jgi:hypothetical protein
MTDTFQSRAFAPLRRSLLKFLASAPVTAAASLSGMIPGECWIVNNITRSVPLHDLHRL